MKKFVFVALLVAFLTLNGAVDASPLCYFWYLECCCEVPVSQVVPAILPAPGVVVDVIPPPGPTLLAIPDLSIELVDPLMVNRQPPARYQDAVDVFGNVPYTGSWFQRISQPTRSKSVSSGYPQPLAYSQAAGYTNYPGYGSYKVHKVGKAWYEALQICANEGATLVVISSAAEAALIKTWFSPSEVYPGAVNNMHFWVGVQERGVDGQFYTVFGDRLEASGYQVWSPLGGGQPNDRGIADCVSTFIDGGYFDDECSARYAFVCETVN